MNSLEKLEKRINDLVEQFERMKAEKAAAEQTCAELRETVTTLTSDLAAAKAENQRLQRKLKERGEVALKRISRLVDKIDEFQTGMKFS